MPATNPMITAPVGVQNAHGEVIATSPASMPLHIMDGSGLPDFSQMTTAVATAPEALASIVLVATMPMRPSAPARELPALNPNQPNARMKVPTITIGMWCADTGLT